MNDAILIIFFVIVMVYWPVVWTIEELMEKPLGPDEEISKCLKPCPFCKHPAHWVNGVSEDLGFIICENCHAKIEGYIGECYEKWNRRVKE